MFNYVGNISDLSHYIVRNFCRSFGTAIDATLGNGHDTDFLCQNFDRILSFEIQKEALERYSSLCKFKDKLTLIQDSHEYFERYIDKGVDCIMYNLGFLPGGDRSITTKSLSTIRSLEAGLRLLNSGGLITIAVYPGHPEGKEEEKALLAYLKELHKNKYGVMLHSYLNRDKFPPSLIIIESK